MDNSNFHHFLNTLQEIIKRVSDNTRHCKTWCITLVSALIAFDGLAGLEEKAKLILLPILTFALMDAYYLYLESFFRRQYNETVEAYNKGELKPEKYAIIESPGSVSDTVIGTLNKIASLSVWPFYLLLAGLAFYLGS